MTIRIWPNRLDGEPVETHDTLHTMSVSDWLHAEVKGYTADMPAPFSVTINGAAVAPDDFPLTQFGPADDVQIHVEPKGIESLIFAVVMLVVFAVMMAMRPNTPTDRRQGRTLSEPGALANTRRYGDPIPEIAGAPRSFPDYLLPPRRYYIATSHTSEKIVIVGRDPETGRPIFERVTVEVFSGGQQWVDAFLCIGMGMFQKSPGDVHVGDTNALSLGAAFEQKFYEPGEDLSGEVVAQWWHTPEEVGFTSLGNSGMTLTGRRTITANWASDLVAAGATISSASTAIPEGWETGQFVRVLAAHPVTFGTNTVQSALLDTMGLVVGDYAELVGNRSGVFRISAIAPGSGGSPGSASTATGDIPPVRLNFGDAPQEFSVIVSGNPYVVSAHVNFTTVAEMVEVFNLQIGGAPFEFSQDAAGMLHVDQRAPYDGSPLGLGGFYTDFFGTTPVFTTGSATVLPVGTTYTLEGAVFTPGEELAVVGKFGLRYQILYTEELDNRLVVTPENVVAWVGFPATVVNPTTVNLVQEATDGGWAGWFAVCPEGETTDCIEVDIFYPGGLIQYNDEGDEYMHEAGGEIEIRPVDGGAHITQPWFSEGKTVDQFGRTIRIDVPPGRYEVRVRASADASDESKKQDKQQWSGLRARIIGAPISYEGVTTMAVRMRSGDKISGSVENKISIRATRILPTIEDPEVLAPTRDIAPFFVHMMSTVGYGRDLLDMAQITALHEIWRGRNDRFDLSVDASTTLKTVANSALNAGFAELTLKHGKITAVRDALRPRIPERLYAPADYTAKLTETTESVQPDDVDGVDVEYVDFTTGRTLTVSYRLPEDLGVRVEKIKALGVTNRTRAWRIAARRRRILAYRRTKYKGATEMQAFNSHYMDHVGLQDGIPGFGQSAFVIGADGNTLWLSEEIKPVNGPMVAFIRKQDGTASIQAPATALGHALTFPGGIPHPVVVAGEAVERPTVVFIGVVNDAMYPALMTSVSPSSNGKCDFTAVNYDERVYAEDDSGPDRLYLTSLVYDNDPQTSLVYDNDPQTSRVYPLEFADTLRVTPIAVAARLATGMVSTVEQLNVTQHPPQVSVTTVVNYTDYDMLPEVLGVTPLAPEVVIKTTVIRTDYRTEPEVLAVTPLAPSVRIRSTANYIDYEDWIPEVLTVTQHEPIVRIETP